MAEPPVGGIMAAATRILIVDDEAGVRETLAQVLEDEGFVPVQAATGEEGLRMLEANGIDLILLDVWLPGRDGLEILQMIKDRGMMTPVVIISGHANIDTAVRATKLGAYDLIEKPLSIDKTLLAVKNALTQRRLEEENRILRGRIETRTVMIGESEAIRRLQEEIRLAAPTNGRVLIQGENGTGKELVARLIHQQSLRRDAPFVEVNCAAIPDEIIESELFGHMRGAFTGAVRDKQGKFLAADTGTLFLDEVGDMSLKTQAKVLRVLQEQKFEPVGSTQAIQVNVRVITATNKDLAAEIKRGTFREDLYFRLNVIPFVVPPLRNRRDDISLLVSFFLFEFSREYGKRLKEISTEAIGVLKEYAWPGNVRELRNLVERLVIMVPGSRIGVNDLPDFLGGNRLSETASAVPSSGDTRSETLQEAREMFERAYLLKRLQELNWNIARTAESVGLERSHFYRKLKSLGISVPRKEEGEEGV